MCPNCGEAFIKQASDWWFAARSEVDSRLLAMRREELRLGKDRVYLEGAIPSHVGPGGRISEVETLRAYLIGGENPRIELKELVSPLLDVRPFNRAELRTVMEACSHALCGLYKALPARHAACFETEYVESFIDIRVAPNLGNPVVGAYRLVEEFLGILAPPHKEFGLSRQSSMRFNRDFFAGHIETSDHLRMLPVEVGTAMAPLIVRSLFVDALEYILDEQRHRPWTLWSLDSDSFNYPVRWYGEKLGKSPMCRVTILAPATTKHMCSLLGQGSSS